MYLTIYSFIGHSLMYICKNFTRWEVSLTSVRNPVSNLLAVPIFLQNVSHGLILIELLLLDNLAGLLNVLKRTAWGQSVFIVNQGMASSELAIDQQPSSTNNQSKLNVYDQIWSFTSKSFHLFLKNPLKEMNHFWGFF